MSAIPIQGKNRSEQNDLPLEAGDHLTATEFIRRYSREDAPPRAELINGVVRLMLPITFGYHANPHANLISWLGFYTAMTPGVLPGAPSSMRLDEDNVPEPDAMLRIPAHAGGLSRIAPGEYVEGAPELVAEIAGTSASFDLHDKLDVYRRHGVREYVVWRVRDKAIDWFVLREGRYVALAPDADGTLKGETFPGLWFDGPALIDGDLGAVMKTVQLGVAATPGHADFVQRLNA